jgi:predicted nucleic acid-binding protein
VGRAAGGGAGVTRVVLSGAACASTGKKNSKRSPWSDLARVRVLPLDPTAAVRAGDILARLDEQGKPIGLEDVLISATALVNSLAVVTRNLTHFERIEGLRVESWFNS